MKNRGTAALLAVLLSTGPIAPLVTRLVARWAAEGQRLDLVNRAALRVCSDPANMPFSNEKGEGFENKIAEIVAAELKVPVEYTWFPQATGFIRQTLFAKRCDVVIGYAQGDELVLNTNHYYRSTYALVYRAGSGLDGVDSLADPRLKDKRIGVVAGTPPGNVMARLGLIERAKPYPLMVDRRYDSPGERMIADIRSGDIDAGVLWGPIAGYFAARGGESLAGGAAAEGARPARAWPIASPSACAISRTTGSASSTTSSPGGRAISMPCCCSSACRCSTSNPV